MKKIIFFDFDNAIVNGNSYNVILNIVIEKECFNIKNLGSEIIGKQYDEILKKVGGIKNKTELTFLFNQIKKSHLIHLGIVSYTLFNEFIVKTLSNEMNLDEIPVEAFILKDYEQMIYGKNIHIILSLLKIFKESDILLTNKSFEVALVDSIKSNINNFKKLRDNNYLKQCLYYIKNNDLIKISDLEIDELSKKMNEIKFTTAINIGCDLKYIEQIYSFLNIERTVVKDIIRQDIAQLSRVTLQAEVHDKPISRKSHSSVNKGSKLTIQQVMSEEKYVRNNTDSEVHPLLRGLTARDQLRLKKQNISRDYDYVVFDPQASLQRRNTNVNTAELYGALSDLTTKEILKLERQNLEGECDYVIFTPQASRMKTGENDKKSQESKINRKTFNFQSYFSKSKRNNNFKILPMYESLTDLKAKMVSTSEKQSMHKNYKYEIFDSQYITTYKSDDMNKLDDKPSKATDIFSRTRKGINNIMKKFRKNSNDDLVSLVNISKPGASKKIHNIIPSRKGMTNFMNNIIKRKLKGIKDDNISLLSESSEFSITSELLRSVEDNRDNIIKPSSMLLESVIESEVSLYSSTIVNFLSNRSRSVSNILELSRTSESLSGKIMNNKNLMSKRLLSTCKSDSAINFF